jgi:enoyl-CoA hydratase/carnithine racemase
VPDDALEQAATALVDDMLAASPMGLRMTKEGLSFAIDAPSLESAMAIENRNQVLCAQSSDFQEGMRAFLEKRRPNYSGH